MNKKQAPGGSLHSSPNDKIKGAREHKPDSMKHNSNTGGSASRGKQG